MSPFATRRYVKAGMPPGSLVPLGERKSDRTAVTCFVYDAHSCLELAPASPAECPPPAGPQAVTWINVDGVHEAAAVEAIGKQYGLHPLVMEDILHTEQRPKVEVYDGYVYVVLRMLHLPAPGAEVLSEQVSLVLGPNWVLLFQEKEQGDVFNPLRERLRSGKGRLRQEGADFLAYSLLDAVVDQYYVILDRLGEQIEELEERVVSRPTPDALKALHAFKREMIFLRRTVWPLREVLTVLARDESPLIRPGTRAYLRDVYDHTVQVMDVVETFRDMLSGLLDVYLSSASHRLNEVMKVLTVITTVFMPMSFIAGIYGMNFDHIPELHWRWGYYAAIGTMAASAAGMLVYFRGKKWL